MGHPYRFVGWWTLVALVWAIFDALTGLSLGIALAAGQTPMVGERALIWLTVQGLSRYGTFVPGVAIALFPSACILAWMISDRWLGRPSWLSRRRAVLAGWLVAIPLAALGPLSAFKVVEVLAHDWFVIGPMLGLAGALWCSGAAAYVALVVQRERERAGQSRIGASWLAIVALATTVGPVQVAWIGGVAMPLWVLWRGGRRPSPEVSGGASSAGGENHGTREPHGTE